jgi:cytochrome P450
LGQLSPISAEDRAALMGLVGGVIQVPAGVDVISPGDDVEYVHLVVEGLLGRFAQFGDGKRQITAIHIPGDMADLHAVIHRLRDDGPVAQVRYFGEPALLLTTYEAVDAAYRDDDLFPAAAAFAEMTEPAMGRTLQCMHGDEHKRNRKLVSPAFRVRIMPDYVRPILEEVAHELIDGFVVEGATDLVTAFNSRFPGRVITRLLGVPDDNDIDLQHCAHRLLSYPNDPAGALEAKAEFTHVLGPLVTQRRIEPRHDLISTLATTDHDG